MPTNDAASEAILQTLRACQQDRAKVVIYLNGTSIPGQLAQVGEQVAELQHNGGRLLLRIDRIDAVWRE